MSRTGPAYVESEEELLSDLERKQNEGEISTEIAEAFTELYEFGKTIGDDVKIRGAKNANFQVKVDAHRGDYPNNISVFTANVNGKLKVWPAERPLRNNSEELVPWDSDDYHQYEREFQSLSGEPHDTKETDFDEFVATGRLDEFKKIVEDFVENCRGEV
ncbi:hypothetical protein [Halostella pelagica]|uniref:hypothetical protein n=1 Tax=Halostella pelagica TaxID=2583824 RepID=UPI001081BBF6|nr:hypothetical protein [Halostella pelagica]